MPFTFSHPAAVLPFRLLPARWYSLTGLVVGSMVPDFEYFLRMKIQSNYSHTIAGLFWFDLPLGLLLAFLFHGLVRNSLFANLPVPLKSRLFRFTDYSWSAYAKRNMPIVLVSILIGAATHLLWDSFTHSDGYFVRTIPTLSGTVDISGMHIKMSKILQHGSTLFGALILAFALVKLPRDKNVRGGINLKYWVVVVTVALAAVAIRLICGLSYKQYGHLVVTCISATLLALLLAPVITGSIKVRRSNV